MATVIAENKKEDISRGLRESSRILAEMAENTQTIESVAAILVEAYRRGNKMVLFGNGGSAADAQHLAAELIGGFTDHNRPGLPALALTTNTSSITSIGNDYNFELIYARQVDSMVNPGDVVFALSTSGRSSNIVQGAKAAKARKAFVVGLTGASGGTLKDHCDYCICVPTENTAHIQEAHITVGHILCALVEKAMANKNSRPHSA